MNAKIEQAAVQCLSRCLDSPAPHSLSTLFLDSLSGQADWSRQELDELRTVVQRVIGKPDWWEEIRQSDC